MIPIDCKLLVFLRECVNSGMDNWNGGMEIFKAYYELLHLNIARLAFFHILSILHLIIDQYLIQFMLAQEY